MAPHFELDGTGGRSYALDDEAGAPVVLVFYPADNTPVCTSQLTAYSDDLASFVDLGARLLAISPQDVASHEAFAADHELAFPLWPMSTRRWERRTACWALSGSTGGRCSWSTRAV